MGAVSGRDDFEGDAFGETSRYTAHLDRGWSLLDRGDLRQARQSALQAHELRPDVPDAAMLMAAIALHEHDGESALEWYDKAIEADGEYVEAQLAAAQVLLYDLDDPQRAIERADQAIDLDEASALDRLDLGLLAIEALVRSNQDTSARARLTGLADIGVLEELFDPNTSMPRASELLDYLGGLHEHEDEHEGPFRRHAQLAIRIAQLHVDLGSPRDALPWLRALLARLEDDAELWYLLNEAAFLAGDLVVASRAALEVLRLDAAEPLPPWLPEPVALHRRVNELLLGCGDLQLARLARDSDFVVFINDRVPPELVLEGVDPRARVLALASRAINFFEPEGEDPPPVLTGLSLYRRSLARFARDAEHLDQELSIALFEELAAYFDLDDARRERLGLLPRVDPVTEAAPIESKRSKRREAAANDEPPPKGGRKTRKKVGTKKSSKPKKPRE
jgi:tetratricopeptide (TPR) repeat protein